MYQPRLLLADDYDAIAAPLCDVLQQFDVVAQVQDGDALLAPPRCHRT